MIPPDDGAPRSRIVVVTGPTATGKSRAALDLAHALEARGRRPFIVSMDAVQVYRGMDVGTDKVLTAEREGVPHHLIDVADPDQTFSAAEFARRTDELIAELGQGAGAALVAGGTGFYLRALMWGLFPGPAACPELRARLRHEIDEFGLEALHRKLAEVDPEAARRILPSDPTRIIRALEVHELTGTAITAHYRAQRRQGPRYPALILGLRLERATMYERIDARVDRMLDRGLIEETRRLRERGYGPATPSQKSLGYRQVHQLLDGEIDRDRAVYLIKRDTRHFSRRQLTWLNKEPGLSWTEASAPGAAIARAIKFLEDRDEET